MANEDGGVETAVDVGDGTRNCSIRDKTSIFQALKNLIMEVKYRKLFGIEEFQTLNFWRSVFGEGIAAFLLIMVVVGSTLKLNENDEISNLQISITGGFTVTMLVSIFSDISGGHFNPSVSFTFLLMGDISILRFCFYVIAQCIGSIAGSGLLYLITPEQFHGTLGVMSLHPNISPGVGYIIEIILASLLLFTIVTCTESNREFNGFQVPFAIGMSVAVALLLGIPYTGASLNPIRPLGSAVIKKQFKDIWVWILGPLTASVTTVLLYKHVLKLNKAPTYGKSRRKDINNGNEDEESHIVIASHD